jgi:hypothetical protein
VSFQPPATVNRVKQIPFDGVSMLYTFDDEKAATRHPTQYFEITGNRGIYHDGWMASTTPLRPPWVITGIEPDPDDFPWELYNVAADFSQAKDLAKQNPQKLQELQALFLTEAARFNVLPIDSSFADRADPSLRPGFNARRTEFTYYPGMVRITEANAPDIKNKSFRSATEVEIPVMGAEGVLATQGGRFGGLSLVVLDGKPMFAHAYSNQDGAQTKSRARPASLARKSSFR